MNSISRRNFLKTSTIGTAALVATPTFAGFEKIFPKINGEMVFRPYPHPWMPKIDFVYAADENEDPIKSGINIASYGISVPKDLGLQKFSINTRWFVEGFGFVFLSADNGGEYFSGDDLNSGRKFNLNYEFARSRVTRNRNILKKYEKDGTNFSNEVKDLVVLSEELYEDAGKKLSDGEKAAKLSDKALNYALWAGEKIELENASSRILKNKLRKGYNFGCETRQLVWVKSEEFQKKFEKLFNYATITHYVWDSWYELFEPHEGHYNWGIKDDIANWLIEKNITIEGRPLFWFNPYVTPDWLKNKNFEQLKKYVVKHAEDLVGHYGDKVLHWEVINEYHDWSNIFNHTPEQITEIVRLACDTTKEVNPKVVKILNNCYPWAEYVAMGKMSGGMKATRPLRSTRKYLEDLINAGVDFDVIGIQIYFPRRDLSDIVRLLERLEKLGKPLYITEIGATSGPNAQSISNGQFTFNNEPYDWHRPWDENLQADWLEQVFNIYYSRNKIKTACWYDFTDFRPYIPNGGLALEDCTPKPSFNRFYNLLGSWDQLPKG
ncbi:MAG: endo-1,4-beta-xylanase [Ignavibacteriaceae bacterium]